MAFMTITEDEAIYILAAIGRVFDSGKEFESDFGMKLCDKIGGNLLPGELHRAERTYQAMRFSKQGDYSVNFIECYHAD
jgi:hypothetical protein